MISDRQKAYRAVYRSRIMGFYDGYLHIAIIYAMGAAAFYIYLQHIQQRDAAGVAHHSRSRSCSPTSSSGSCTSTSCTGR